MTEDYLFELVSNSTATSALMTAVMRKQRYGTLARGSTHTRLCMLALRLLLSILHACVFVSLFTNVVDAPCALAGAVAL